MFGIPAKKKTVDVDGKQVELQPKPSPLSKIFNPKPQGQKPQAQAPASAPIQPSRPSAPTPPPPKPSGLSGLSGIFTPSPPRPQTQAQAQPQPGPAPPPPAPTQPKPTLLEAVRQEVADVKKDTVQANKPYPFQLPTNQPQSQPQPQPQKPAAPSSPPPAAPLFNMKTPAPSSPPPRPLPPRPAPITQPRTAQPRTSQARPGKPNSIKLYIEGVGRKHPDLEAALRKEGIKSSLYDFIKRMLTFSLIFTIVIGVVTAIILYQLVHDPVTAVVLALLVSLTVFITSFRAFLNFPTAKGRSSAKKVERDILFAARDLIIALRSGMPLFNAITSVSSGYGEASKEFLKVVEKVQLGTPLEDAIDQTVAQTKSPSFRKIMLQASVSIRVGADVTAALQSIIDQLSQERIIELRRYGQRLNAIAMFYMLFGIILPSMGIAVLTILTTFIPVFSVDFTLLEVVVVGIIFLQVVFLEMIRSSRPVFSM